MASALVAESFRRHRERGMTSAGLGVDGDNPSGALGLYEQKGNLVGVAMVRSLDTIEARRR